MNIKCKFIILYGLMIFCFLAFESTHIAIIESIKKINVYDIASNNEVDSEITLSSIRINGIEIDNFESNRFSYYKTLYTSEKSVTIDVEKTSSKASLVGDLGLQELKEGKNNFSIIVISEDTLRANRYEIYITKVDKRVEGVLATAYAYYNKGSALQYDDIIMSYKASKNGGTYRVQAPFSPEEVSSKDMYYTHCANFVWNVYHEALDFDITSQDISDMNGIYHGQHANIDVDSKYRVYYHEVTDNDKGKEKEILQDFVSNLLPGDVICYKGKNSDGSTISHVMLYLGDDDGDGNESIMHASYLTYDGKTNGGGVYDQKNKKDYDEINGCILRENFDILIKPNSETGYKANRYLFNGKINRFGIIRPIQPDNKAEFPLTDNTKARLKIKDVYFDRTLSIGKYDNLNLGETFQVKLTFCNKGTSTKEFIVTEKLSDLISFVSRSNNGTYSNGVMTWDMIINPGETVVVSYKARVKNDVNNLGKNILCTTNVNGLVFQSQARTIKRQLYSHEKVELNNNIFKTSGDTTASFIKNLYKNAFEVDIDLPGSYEIMSNIFNVEIIGGNRMLIPISGDSSESNVLKKMQVENLYAGSFVITKDIIDKQYRTRRTDVDTLSEGDILVIISNVSGDKHIDTNIQDREEMYLYISDGLLYIDRDTGEVKILTNNDMINKLDTFIGEKAYAVLRPSQVFEISDIKTVDSILIDGVEIENFKKDTEIYEIKVSGYKSNVDIQATVTDLKARVSGLGNKELKQGLNTFEIYVTSESGNSKKYILNITRNGYYRGDVNLDGIVNSTDLQRLYIHLNGNNIITDPEQKLIADINSDGTINSTDLQRLYSYLNGSNPF